MKEDCKEDCKECKCEENGFTISVLDLGIIVTVLLDPNAYDKTEEEEIAMMVARVIDAWVKRRETVLMNPGVFGIAVN